MSAASRDTHPEADRVQLDLLRRAGPARRFALTRSLSATAITLSRRALRERMPGASEQEVLLRWVALNYSMDLALRLAAVIAARERP